MSEISTFGINFSQFECILNLKDSNIMYKAHLDLKRQKIGGKSVSYTQAYTVVVKR